MYNNGTEFWSRNMGNALRLSNGNTLINNAVNGTFFEVDEDEHIVWKYQSPLAGDEVLDWDETEIPLSPANGIDQDNEVFKVFRYAADYPGLAGKLLTPGSPLEIYSSVTIDSVGSGVSYTWQGEAYDETGIYIESGHYLDLFVGQSSSAIHERNQSTATNVYTDGHELVMDLDEAQELVISVFALNGSLVVCKTQWCDAGMTRVSLGDVNKAVYLVKLTDNTTSSSVVQKITVL